MDVPRCYFKGIIKVIRRKIDKRETQMNIYKDIKTDDELIDLRKHFITSKIYKIAMDFECESNLHQYGEKLCLIQIYDGNDFYLIDPFKISRNELANLLEDKNILKYFYSAGSDKSLVYKQYKIKINSIYDQSYLVDVLGLEKKGLDAVLFSQLNIKIMKKKKYQKYNWIKRPIDEDAKQYALSDVEHLFALNQKLTEIIIEQNKMDYLIHHIVSETTDYEKKSIPSIYRKKEFKSLNKEYKKNFIDIVDIREKYAKQLNIPPNTLLSNKDIEKLSKNIKLIGTLEIYKKMKQQEKIEFINEILNI